MATIYMPLLNGSADAWRPAEATQLRNGRYRVKGHIPGGERWAFNPGTVVVCAWRSFSNGEEGPAAIAADG